jgi:hypothetical protein
MVLTASRTGAMKFGTLRVLIFPSVLALFCSLQLFRVHPDSAFAQDASTNETGIAPGAQVTKPKPPKAPAAQKQKNFGEWKPQDIDQQVPAIVAGRACSLPEVLSQAGKRIQDLVDNVNRFTATEVVEHQTANSSGRLGRPETRTFNYVVSLAQTKNGYMTIQEYRKGDADEFPGNVGTVGTPGVVLIFHPRYAPDFAMKCEGLGAWRGQPAWQVRFEQRANRTNHMSVLVVEGQPFNVRLRGRAWILADSYEVARLETDLADQIPKIRLRLQHQAIEYHPVDFPGTKATLWLPSSTELYMDFMGHRFYRRHSFAAFKLFSVQVQQEFGNPSGMPDR